MHSQFLKFKGQFILSTHLYPNPWCKFKHNWNLWRLSRTLYGRVCVAQKFMFAWTVISPSTPTVHLPEKKRKNCFMHLFKLSWYCSCEAITHTVLFFHTGLSNTTNREALCLAVATIQDCHHSLYWACVELVCVCRVDLNLFEGKQLILL